jgi:hypothetical protein
MPKPMSLISMTSPPLPVCTAETRTCEIGGEYRNALSSSSASRCTRSPATTPSTSLSGTDAVMTRA